MTSSNRLAVNVGYAAGPSERADLIERVKVADDLGVDSVWVAEAWGRDAFTFLTHLALETKNVNLGTAIVNVFSRSPALLAMTVASLDELSGGRMVLGLGSSGANVVEHWHGVPFEKPLTRLREYVEIINMIMRGEPLQYEGKVFKLERGFRLQFTPLRKHVPIYIAAITPKSIEQTGEIGDGWMPIFWPKERFAEGIERLSRGARSAGRRREDLTVAPAIGLFLTDGDAEPARRAARQPIAFYVGRMGVFYREMLADSGFEREVEEIRAAWDRRDPEAAAAAVSDAMLDTTTIVGGLEECREKLNERRRLGVDLPVVTLPGGTPSEVGRKLERLMQ